MQGQEPVKVEIDVNNELAEVVGFAESDGGRFNEKILGGCIQGEDVETFPKDSFQMMDTWIIHSVKKKVMVSWEGLGFG